MILRMSTSFDSRRSQRDDTAPAGPQQAAPPARERVSLWQTGGPRTAAAL